MEGFEFSVKGRAVEGSLEGFELEVAMRGAAMVLVQALIAAALQRKEVWNLFSMVASAMEDSEILGGIDGNINPHNHASHH